MGRGRGENLAVGVGSFDSAFGRRRGTGETPEQAEARDPQTPAPVRDRSPLGVAARLKTTAQAGERVDEYALADVADIFNDTNLMVSMPMKDLVTFKQFVLKGTVTDAYVRERDAVRDVADHFGIQPLSLDETVAAKSVEAHFYNQLRIAQDPGTVSPETFERASSEAVVREQADHFVRLLCDADGEVLWRHLPDYEHLHRTWGARRFLPDRGLSEVVDPDRLRACLESWMQGGQKTLAPAFERTDN